MTHRPLVILLLVVPSLVLLGGCSDDDPTATEPAPILTITNSWGVEGVANHSFQFSSPDDGEDAGAFTGDEQTPDFDFFDLSGTWADGHVTFTVDRDGGVTYTATFDEDNPTRLRFRSGDEELVLLLGG
jgi:hypothetical protein